MIPPEIRAVVFDLGDTLVEYEGVPLSWEAHYTDALANLAAALDASWTPAQIAAGCEVLRRYNTRLAPRERETSFADILAALWPCFGRHATPPELPCARAFFGPFRQRLRAFPDARPTLEKLRRQGLKVGLFTDVPYGMPTELVREDIHQTGLDDCFDIITTSRDAGFRKPAPETLTQMASQLANGPHELLHVGNEKKDIDVARSVGGRSVLVDRDGRHPDWGQQRTITSLSDL